MRQWKPLAVDHQSHHHLLAVRPVIAPVAALGLGVARGLALEVRRGQVVEEAGVVTAKQRALALGQGRLDLRALRMQAVEVAVQRLVAPVVEIHLDDVRQRATPDPVGHGVLGARANQAVHRHGQRQHAGTLAEPDGLQNLFEVQLAPVLHPDMHRPCRAMLLGAYAIGVDAHQISAVAPLPARAPPANALHHLAHLAIFGAAQVLLPAQCGFDFARQFHPLIARARAQVAERADHLLARALRGANGFNQNVVGVGLPLVAALRLAHEHVPLRITT